MIQVKEINFCFYKSQNVYLKTDFNGIYMNLVVICGILLHKELNLFSCMSVDWVSQKLNKISAAYNYQYGYMVISWYFYKISKIIHIKKYPLT